MGETYAAAGVDLAAGDEVVERIRARMRATFRPEVLGDVGGFGGLFAFDPGRYRQPVLVSSTDGVGTKAVVAETLNRYDTIGIDLVAMSVDDVATLGAEPLFFLDYVAVGRLEPERLEELVGGIAEGCRQAGCSLIGGETAEHPGTMEPGRLDLAGFAVGVVERDRMVTGDGVQPGDRVLGLPSPGLRSNGYSLARRVLLEKAGRSLGDPAWPGASETLGDELLRPSVIYAPAVVALTRAVDVRALAHITGGGLPGNLRRSLPPTCDAVLRRERWAVPGIFTEIQRLGAVDDDEMARVFNLGIGMVAVVRPDDVERALATLAAAGTESLEIGEIVPGAGEIRLA